MKTYLDCIPCFLNQALRAGRMATRDEIKLKVLLDEVGTVLREIPLKNTPPETGMLIYEKVRLITGELDPYKEVKEKNISHALGLYSYLKNEINNSDDRLLTAIRFAIAGNVIDFGVNKKFDIEDEINIVLKKNFAVLDYDKFKLYLDKCDEVLYIGDNAGESVFDRILIEEIKKTVTYVVREIPVINDVTREDAL